MERFSREKIAILEGKTRLFSRDRAGEWIRSNIKWWIVVLLFSWFIWVIYRWKSRTKTRVFTSISYSYVAWKFNEGTSQSWYDCVLTDSWPFCFVFFLPQQTGSSKSSPSGFNPSFVSKHVADIADVPFDVSIDESNVRWRAFVSGVNNLRWLGPAEFHCQWWSHGSAGRCGTSWGSCRGCYCHRKEKEKTAFVWNEPVDSQTSTNSSSSKIKSYNRRVHDPRWTTSCGVVRLPRQAKPAFQGIWSCTSRECG